MLKTPCLNQNHIHFHQKPTCQHYVTLHLHFKLPSWNELSLEIKLNSPVMAKNRPSIFPCTRGIYLIFLWYKNYDHCCYGHWVVLHPEPPGPFLLLLHTLPQDLMCVFASRARYTGLSSTGTPSPGMTGLQEQKARVSVCKLTSAPPHLSSQPMTGGGI